MAKDGFVQVPPQSTGQKVDGSSISVQGQVVIRQRIVLADASASAQFAIISGGALTVRGQLSLGPGTSHIGQVSVTGSVAISNTTFLVSITGTAIVALAAGTAHIGQVSVTGSVAISSLPNVNISAMPTVTVTGGVAVSGTAVVSGNVSITGTVVAVVSNFLAGSGQSINVVDTANTALRVNVVAGAGGGANPVSIAAGTSNIGFINNISASVVVTGISGTAVAIAGTVAISNPVSLVSITGTVVVSGQVSVTGTLAVSLLAGTANIGTINNISAAVVLAAGAANIGTLNGISATVLVAGAVTFAAASAAVSINGTVTTTFTAANAAVSVNGTVNVSIAAATVIGVSVGNTVSVNLAAQSAGLLLSVQGSVNLTAGASVIVQGPVAHSLSCTAGVQPLIIGGRAHISASANVSNLDVTYAWLDLNGRQITVLNHPSLLPSASHGPKTVAMSSSATVALIASPGGTASIYVDALLATNGSNTLTQLQIYEASATGAPVITTWLAANGGGFQMQFNPPWKISVATALNMRLKPSVSTNNVTVMVHFHVGPT